MNCGLFITFEGPEGSGKSTIAKKLFDVLKHQIDSQSINYKKIILTREPGGFENQVAEKIRSLILDSNNKIDSLTEALLFASARSIHVNQTIKPILKQNGIVVCDRYVDSSIVYQQYAQNVGNVVTEINKIAIDGVKPDIIFYFKIEPELGLQRIKDNQRATNKFDNANLEFHKKISFFYDQHFANKNNVYFIDASLSIDDVLNQCLNVVNNYMKSK